MQNFFLDLISKENETMVTITDLDGVITHVNQIFCKFTGYSKKEIIGQKHSILRHPDTPQSVFKELWSTLRKKGKWSGCLKNIKKDKTEYIVFIEIQAVYNNSKKVGYKSKRTLISD